MGTQQILLIVLSVIIVGAAIAVGIQMFNNQAYSANKTAIAADAQNYATQVVQYYKTPTSQGGAGGAIAAGAETKIGNFIGWGGTGTSNANGSYVLGSTSNNKVIIYGLGKEVKDSNRPAVKTTITLPEGKIEAEVIDTNKTAASELSGASWTTQ